MFYYIYIYFWDFENWLRNGRVAALYCELYNTCKSQTILLHLPFVLVCACKLITLWYLSMTYQWCLSLSQIGNAIPILNQSDLDQAIEILDRSQHLTSLRILLSLPNGVTESAVQHKTVGSSSMLPPSNPKVGSLFGISSKSFYVREGCLLKHSMYPESKGPFKRFWFLPNILLTDIKRMSGQRRTKSWQSVQMVLIQSNFF